MKPLFSPQLVLSFFLLVMLGSCGNVGQELDRPANQLVIRQEVEPDRLFPCLTTSGYARQVYQQIFQYLLTQDPVTFEFVPQLAKGRPQREVISSGPYRGNTALTYELFEQATWDDGRPVTAEDFIFSLKVILNPKVPAARFRPFLFYLVDVVPDPENPRRFTAYFPSEYIQGEEVMNSLTPVLPRHHYDPEGLMNNIPLTTLLDEAKTNALLEQDDRLQRFAEQITQAEISREPEWVMGSGPYRLDSWQTKQQIRLLRKENWWGDSLEKDFPGLAAYPEALVFRLVPDNETALIALQGQELDVVSRIQSQSFEELKNDPEVADHYEFHSPVTLENYSININTRDPLLSDKRVRRALAHAIDVEEIIREVQLGLAIPSTGPVHPTVPYFNADLQPISYDPQKARALLAEAGWEDTNGNGLVDRQIEGARRELELVLLVTPNSEYLGLLMQKHASLAGIQLKLEARDFRTNLEAMRNGQYQLAFNGAALSTTLWDPREQYHSQAGDNRTGFGTAESDQLIDRLLVTLDEAERNRMYDRLQEIIYEEQPAVWLYVSKGRVVTHRRFQPVITPLFPNYEPRLFRLAE